MGRIGVLLLNLGGPDELGDVRPFLYNLFSDPEIIRLPFSWLQKPLAWMIATSRSRKSEENYKQIGGGSPLRRITEAQAQALTDQLKNRGYDVVVHIAMRYWHPFTEEALIRIKRDQVERLVILPLYPQFSISTSGSSFRILEKLWYQDAQLRKIQHTIIPSWYDHPDYLQAMAELIRTCLDQSPEPDQVHIFFSAHGVPRSYVDDAGDPYQKHIETCTELIMKTLGRPNAYTLAYQSRVGPVEWLQPYTEDAIVSLAASGVKSLLVVPISFVSEHIETLQEIDIEYREIAEKAGIEQFQRVPAPNLHPRFIQALANLVEDALQAPPVPLGSLEQPPRPMKLYPQEKWAWGMTTAAEVWNGRLAMIGFVALVIEIISGRGLLHLVGLM